MDQILNAYDTPTGIAVMLATPTAGEPPTEIKIFRRGVTHTTKGKVLLDAEGGASVMSKFAEHGLDMLPVDVGHGMFNPFSSPESHASYGWFRPEMRDGDLYAAGIQWTAKGDAALRAREFRFFSPAVLLDKESGRIQKLLNIALTNLPATRGQQPLMASSVGSPLESTIVLTDAEKKICELTGVDTAKFLEQKAIEKTAKAEQTLAGFLTDDQRKLAWQLGIPVAELFAQGTGK